MRKGLILLSLLMICTWRHTAVADESLTNVSLTQEEIVAKTMQLAYSHPQSPFTQAGFKYYKATHVDKSFWHRPFLTKGWSVEFEFRLKHSAAVFLGVCTLVVLSEWTDESVKHLFYAIPSCKATDLATGDRVFHDIFQGGLGDWEVEDPPQDDRGWGLAQRIHYYGTADHPKWQGYIELSVYAAGEIEIEGDTVKEIGEPVRVIKLDHHR